MKSPKRIKSHLRGETDGKGCLAIIVFCVIGYFFSAIFLDNKGSSSSSGSSSSREPSLTGSMDGRAWNAASSGSKQALAADIAKRLNEGNVSNVSSGFIYSALDSFYSSSEPSVLNTSISQVVGLSVAAAQ